MDIVTQIWSNKILSLSAFAGAILLYHIRKYFNGGVCTNQTRLDGRTVIVTGASSGIGAATALELARRGARVIMACRNMLEGEKVASNIVDKTGSKSIVIQQLDLASFWSIKKFVERVESQETRLDILINNAGVGGAPEGRTKDGIELHFGTNHIGHFLLTSLLLDMLKKSATSSPTRVITVSSKAHEYGRMNFDNINLDGQYKSFKAYSQSKLANVLFTRELARRTANSGVVCMVLHPGAVYTNNFRHVNPVIRFVMLLLRPLFLKSAYYGAQTTIHCATMDVTPEMTAGKALYFTDCKPVEPSPAAENDEHARRLWDLSEQMTGHRAIPPHL